VTSSTSMSAPAAAAQTPTLKTGRSGVIERRPGIAEHDPSRFRRRRRIHDNVLRWGSPLLVVLLWQLFSMAEVLDPQFWPSPTRVFDSTIESISSGVLLKNAAVTLGRFIVGWGAGALMGLAIGFLLGTFRPVRLALEPLVSALFTVPKLALFPLLLLLFGLGEAPKIILIAMTVFVVVTISTTSAIIAIPAGMKEPLRSFGASKWQMFTHLTFPAVLPEIFVSLRITTGMAVLVLVAIEMVQGASGLGYMIWSSWQVYDVDRMYVGIVTMSVLGVILQYIVLGFGHLAMPWRPSAGRGH